jgi:hypothetical protein
VFRIIIIPGPAWIILSMEINVGLALIGAVVGISASNAGLGIWRYIFRTFDMSWSRHRSRSWSGSLDGGVRLPG